ncbi:hypothetical protein LIER_16644 [Lithospermum erythrorhizon]|uniref:NAC domain-containing protein n=1 Tax=Lithospermum erythrorhizon TaxID=34254 RepID=A0AAV3Q9C1_LITER
MEIDKSCFVKIGDGLRLPIGFRFRPTDEELVVHYLKRKIHSFPLPASVIPEQEIFYTNPWDLPGDLKDRRYFFSKNNENVKKYSCRVQAGCGYWKAIGQDKPIFDSLSQNHHQIVGMKRTSVFCQRKKRPQRIQTWWIMHQFFLVDSIAKPPSTKNLIVQTGDWLVCCIFQQKKRGARKKVVKKQESLIIEGDNHKNNSLGNSHTDEDCSSPCCSSGVTEIETSNELEVVEQDHEVTSCGRYANSI